MLKRVIILLTLLTCQPSFAITLSAAQLTTTPQYTRLILESKTPITPTTASLPELLVIDLNEVKSNAILESLPRKISKDDPYLKSLHISHTDKLTRLTFDLKAAVKSQMLAIQPMPHKRYRLVFDFSASNPQAALPAQKSAQRLDMSVLINLSESNNPASKVAAPKKAEDDAIVHIAAVKQDRQADIQISALHALTENPPRIDRQADIQIPALHTPSENTTRQKMVFYNAERRAPPKVNYVARIEKVNEPPRIQIIPPTPKSPFVDYQDEESFAPPSESNSTWQNGRRMLVIAIDAGHGGQDPGAIGYYGSYEKNITLAIARQVKILLANTPNLRGILTRPDDIFIPLTGRVDRAHQANADLFISIHADSFINASAQGSSVYTLSKHGASSSAANWLANKENNADVVGGVVVPTKDPAVMRALFDLSQVATVKDGQHLAGHILKELGRINELHRGKVEQAGFAVLKSPSIPSILIEAAFISNPNEENRLNNAAYQARIAAAIVRGIQHYFAQNPALNSQKLARND